MAMEGKMSVIKYLMFFFNFLFWLSGLALIVIGAIIRDKYGDYLTFASSKYASAAVFLIVVGVVVFIIGFLGCCGAIKENYCMVTTFAVILTIIFILEIAAGALGFAYRKKVKSIVDKALDHGMNKYSTEDGAKKFFDWLQKDLKCCGMTSAKDWENKTISAPSSSSGSSSNSGGSKASGGNAGNSSNVNATTAAPVTTQAPTTKSGNGTAAPSPPKDKVPASCKDKNGKIYQEGCQQKFEDFVQKNLVLIGGVGIGLAFLQILGIIFACCLMREIRGQYEVV